MKKLGEAGQPWRTPRFRSNSGPSELSKTTFALASKYKQRARRTLDGERNSDNTWPSVVLFNASYAPL